MILTARVKRRRRLPSLPTGNLFLIHRLPSEWPMASARAGNVIGGGDWAEDRIIPDAIRSLRAGESIPVRNKDATRPWQHVLDPLSGYLTLGAAFWARLAPENAPGGANTVCSAFNFGPHPASNQTVATVVDELLKHWPGQWVDRHDSTAPHEAALLKLNIEKAEEILGWRPVWNFEDAIAQTASWYRRVSCWRRRAHLNRATNRAISK